MQHPVPLHIHVHQWRESERRNVPERLVRVLSRKQCGTLLRHHNLKSNRERCTCWIQQFFIRALYNLSVFQQFGLTFASLFYFCYCVKLCFNVLFCRRAPLVLCLDLVHCFITSVHKCGSWHAAENCALGKCGLEFGYSFEGSSQIKASWHKTYHISWPLHNTLTGFGRAALGHLGQLVLCGCLGLNGSYTVPFLALLRANYLCFLI